MYLSHPQYFVDSPFTSFQVSAVFDCNLRLQMSEVPSAGVWQLNPDFYCPTEAEVAFFKSQTGIHDDGELKEHIVKIQHEAWDVRFMSPDSRSLVLASYWYVWRVGRPLRVYSQFLFHEVHSLS